MTTSRSMTNLKMLSPTALPDCKSLDELHRCRLGVYKAADAVSEVLGAPNIIDVQKRKLIPAEPNFLTDNSTPFPSHSPGHPLYLSKLPEALCTKGGIIITSDNLLFSESFRHLTRARFRTGIACVSVDKFSITQKPVDCATVYGKSLFLDGEHFGEFGHFSAEILTRLWVNNLIDLGEFKFICGPVAKPFLMALLKPFGIRLDQIILNIGALVCEHLFVPSQSFIVRQSTSEAARSVWRTISDYYAAPAGAEKIYISRMRISQRKLANEKNVESLFEAAGFKVIYPELLPINEQVNIFRNATYVAGCSGSNMFGCFYAIGAQKRFFLTSPNYILHTDILMITNPLSELTYFVGDTKTADIHAEWTVDIVTLERAIQKWLS
jgi:capsular polysaccharide biosynthesis protein